LNDKIQLVLNKEIQSAVCVADAIEFLSLFADDSLDLIFTSPPYEDCRKYGNLNFKLKGEQWVKWMVQFVEVASKKCKGLIAINCEGKTEKFRNSLTPFLLMADLHRAGFNLRKPAVFHRQGIMGSGGPDWLRNDWEPIICITRPGRLVWSDNTACGKPPVYSHGGGATNRTKSGDRAKAKEYACPDIANPGNVISLDVGGGHMGHPLAHEGEAPFPVKLPEFFIYSFCPPDGIVCDPFSGTGTTRHAALHAKRRFVGCDIDPAMVSLSNERMETVTPTLF